MSVIERAYEKAREQMIPLGVHFDLTYRCHQRCVHCYIPESWRRGEGPEPELTTVQIKKILDQLAKAGTFLLSFSGGEIFLRPDLMELVTYARSLNFSLSLYTSGTLGLGEDQIRNLAALGVEALFVSIYHLDPAVHDQVTRIPGSGKLLWQTLDRCWNHGVRTAINSPALSINYKGIPEILKFTEARQSALRLDTFLSPRWDGAPHPAGLAISGEERERLWAELGFSGRSEEKCNPLTVPEISDSKRCDVGFNQCYIRPYGEVWPCMEIHWSCGVLGDGMDFDKLWKHSATLCRIRDMQTKELLETMPCVYLRDKLDYRDYKEKESAS